MSAITETTTYRTADGDMLDAICAEHYDGDVTMLPAVLSDNPGLADQPPVLPSGVSIVLPPARVAVRQVLRLWD